MDVLGTTSSFTKQVAVVPLLILPRNRTALANLVSTLGTKQPRAMVNEDRNNHRGKHGKSYILSPEEKTDGIFICQNILLKVELITPIEHHKEWVSEEPATQHR